MISFRSLLDSFITEHKKEVVEPQLPAGWSLSTTEITCGFRFASNVELEGEGATQSWDCASSCRTYLPSDLN